MKKSIIFLIVFLSLIAFVFVYMFFINTPSCYDGYGRGIIVSKNELLTTLLKVNASEGQTFSYPLINESTIAYERYACGNTKYYIKEGLTYKKVSKVSFDNFVQEQNTLCNDCLVKIHSSGNSPLFVDELASGNKYFIGLNGSSYSLLTR